MQPGSGFTSLCVGVERPHRQDTGFMLDTIADVVADWLAPRPAPARRIAVPDVCGLFAGPCRWLIGDRACMPRWSGWSRIRCRSRDWWWISLRCLAARFAGRAP